MQVFDGHNDALLRLARGGPDPVATFRDGEPGHVDAVKAKAGGMRGGFFAMFALDETVGLDFAIFDAPPYDTPLPPELAQDVAWPKIARQAEIAGALEKAGLIRFMRSSGDVHLHGDALAGVLHLEGAECIGPDLQGLSELFELGLRSIGPVWSRPTAFAHGVPFRFPGDGDTGPGLTEAGRSLVGECLRLGMIVDTSHMTVKGFWDVADEGAPLVATHSNAYAISPSARNLTDDQLRAIGETNGMVGLNFGTMFLRPDGKRDPVGALDYACTHLAHMIELAGEEHVGLGSDFDGAPMPQGLRHAGDLPILVQRMRDFGFGADLIKKLCRGNWLAFLRRNLNDVQGIS